MPLVSEPTNTTSRKVVVLHADAATQERLRDWAQMVGFDLGWNYDGWPIAKEDFLFHVTLLASKNDLDIPEGWRSVGPIALRPVGFEVLGVDRQIPTLRIEADETLSAMRQFFIDEYGAEPTFDEFKPHVSLSYRWDGSPDVEKMDPPTGWLVFDALRVAAIDDEPAKDTIMQTIFTDAAEVSGTRRTKDGYLVADVRVARTGTQKYAGYEVGRPDLQTVNVYRPPEEVFKSDSLMSYGHKPVTMGHPYDGVSADNWRQVAIGNVGGDVVRDGGYVRVPLVVMDTEAITAIESGTREISMGYDVRLEFKDGVTPEGEAYQAIQRDIRINHAAIVERGRAGPACRIGDGRHHADKSRQPATNEGHQPMNLRKITVDGLTIDATEQAAQVIEKQQKAIDDAKAALAKAADDVKALSDKHAEAVAAKDKEIEDLKAQIPTVDQLEKMLADRVALIDAAKKLVPDLDCAKLAAADVRKTVVAKKLGDDAVKDKSDEHIAAQFDTLSALVDKSGGNDPVRETLISGTKDAAGKAVAARDKYLADQSKAWAA